MALLHNPLIGYRIINALTVVSQHGVGVGIHGQLLILLTKILVLLQVLCLNNVTVNQYRP